MTKTNKTKLALLCASAFFSATSAHAQVADNWLIDGDVTVKATNSSTDGITLNGNDGTNAANIDAASIAAGYKNSISGAAVGSSASSSFTVMSNNAYAEASSAVAAITGNLSVTSGNEDAVSNLNDLTESPTIAAGTGNSISLAAVGSSASGSSTVTSAGAFDANLSTSYTISGDVTIQAGSGTETAAPADLGGNTGAVSLTLAEGIATPTITAGDANSISAAGVGSSASFSIASNTVDIGKVAEYAVVLEGALAVNSSNSGSVTVAAPSIDTASIATGNSNSISAAAVGSSASTSIANNAYFGSNGDVGNTITSGEVTLSTVDVQSFNEGSISNTSDLTNAPTIGAGAQNSISVAGVGSSASFSQSVSDYTGGAILANANSTNSVGITSLNVGAVLVTAGMATPTISEGYNNSISAAAVGASASQSIMHLNVIQP